MVDLKNHHLGSYCEKKGEAYFNHNETGKQKTLKLSKMTVELMKAEYTRGQNDALVKVRKALGV